MASAASASGVNIFRNTFQAPAWQYIDPKADAEADALQIANGLISPRRKHAERGRDWEEVATEIVQDNAYAIDLAKQAADEINSTYTDDKQPVHWRELIQTPLPEGVQMQMMDSAPGEEETEEVTEAPATEDNS